MIDISQIRHDSGEPSRRQHQGIATGQITPKFPAYGYSRVHCDTLRAGGSARLARADHFWRGEQEPAIHRADVNQLEQHLISSDVRCRRQCDARDRRSDRRSPPASTSSALGIVHARSDRPDRRYRSSAAMSRLPPPHSARPHFLQFEGRRGRQGRAMSWRPRNVASNLVFNLILGLRSDPGHVPRWRRPHHLIDPDRATSASITSRSNLSATPLMFSASRRPPGNLHRAGNAAMGAVRWPMKRRAAPPRRSISPNPLASSTPHA